VIPRIHTDNGFASVMVGNDAAAVVSDAGERKMPDC